MAKPNHACRIKLNPAGACPAAPVTTLPNLPCRSRRRLADACLALPAGLHQVPPFQTLRGRDWTYRTIPASSDPTGT